MSKYHHRFYSIRLQLLVLSRLISLPFISRRDQSCTDILDLYHRLKSEISSGEEAEVTLGYFVFPILGTTVIAVVGKFLLSSAGRPRCGL